MLEIKIQSRHKTLTEAVELAKIDLSYNPRLAKDDLKMTDRNVREAFVCEDGKVRFIYSGDIDVLNEYSPFVGCIHDGPFRLVWLNPDSFQFTDIWVKKTSKVRKMVAELQQSSKDCLVA